MKILIIEDGYLQRRTLERALKPYGDVMATGESDEGLQIARSQSPDVVITDLGMRGNNADHGAWLDELAAACRHALVIVFTARTSSDVAAEVESRSFELVRKDQWERIVDRVGGVSSRGHTGARMGDLTADDVEKMIDARILESYERMGLLGPDGKPDYFKIRKINEAYDRAAQIRSKLWMSLMLLVAGSVALGVVTGIGQGIWLLLKSKLGAVK